MALDLSSIGNWFKKVDNLKGLGTALVAGGSLYNDYSQNKTAKKNAQLTRS